MTMQQMVFVQRFGQKIVGAGFHGLDGGFDRAMGGHDDHRKVFGLLDGGEPLEDLKAAEPRHVQIEEHEVRRFLLDLLERLDAVTGDDGAIVGGLETILQHRGNVRIVVDDENFRFHELRERRARSCVDCASSDCSCLTLHSLSMTFMTKPVSGFGKKYVDLCGMRSPAVATACTSLTLVALSSRAPVPVPFATQSRASWSSFV